MCSSGAYDECVRVVPTMNVFELVPTMNTCSSWHELVPTMFMCSS